jgi:Tfp pilus assembly protein PilX
VEIELTMAKRAPRLHLRQAPRRERGVMLLIALIVLVALTMAGIAMMRSVDTSTIVAGNIGFRQSAVNAADQGVQAGYGWVLGQITGAALSSDDPTNGYFSSVPAGEAPDWYTNPNAWLNAVAINGGAADAAGNTVSYLVHRLCPVPNCAPNAACGGVTNVCGQSLSSAALSGEGMDQSSPNYFTSLPSVHYRVTVRSVGPRNSVAYVQTLMRQ